MRSRTRWLWVAGAFVALLALAAASAGPIMSQVEQPKYEVQAVEGSIEIRRYAPMIVAEATTTGDRRSAINEGFRLIADYIFGNNLARQQVEMTAPVIQERSEKIAMTAPVVQESAGEARWQVRFIMPSRWTMATLPAPKDARVSLREVPEKRVVAIRFSGRATDDTLAAKTSELRAFVMSKGLSAVGEPQFAFYNPPWTLPFLRRNEVVLELAG